MKGKVGSTHDGMVTLALPTTVGDVYSMSIQPDDAEQLAHALLIQAYCARGNTPSQRQFRQVDQWRLR